MSNFTTNTYILKREILSFSNKISNPNPFSKRCICSFIYKQQEELFYLKPYPASAALFLFVAESKNNIIILLTNNGCNFELSSQHHLLLTSFHLFYKTQENALIQMDI